MNLKELTTEQLKVIGYDLIAGIQNAQKSLNLVNEELERRFKKSEIEKVEETKK